MSRARYRVVCSGSQAAIEAQVHLPTGYLVTWGGQFRLQQEANKRLAIVIPLTLLIVFLLLFSSFQSLRNALLILLNIPLARGGGHGRVMGHEPEFLRSRVGGIHRAVWHRA